MPGTVTGEITGLTDNATSAATHVWINSIVGPLDFSPGLTTPFETFTSSDDNSFTVSGGKITEAFYIAGNLGEAGFLFDLITLSVEPQNSLQGLDPPWTIGNTDGLAGVTFTPELAPVPETSTWAMLLVGFAGLAFAGYRAKAKTSLSAA